MYRRQQREKTEELTGPSAGGNDAKRTVGCEDAYTRIDTSGCWGHTHIHMAYAQHTHHAAGGSPWWESHELALPRPRYLLSASVAALNIARNSDIKYTLTLPAHSPHTTLYPTLSYVAFVSLRLGISLGMPPLAPETVLALGGPCVSEAKA